MIPCFALLLLFLVIDTASFVIPFYASRFGDGPWGTPDRMAFLTRAMASALAFGFLAAVAADRRNHSGWWFLVGHAGFPLALVLAIAGWDLPPSRAQAEAFALRGPFGAMLMVITTGFLGTVLTFVLTRRARPALAPPARAMSGTCRLMFNWGNIWFGISLMAAIGVSVAVGTLLENRFGAKGAQFLVYRSPWFGAIFFAGGISMLCATFRKYPFRLEQAGWLTVHSGLALVVIGGMTSFLSSIEGDVTIREGQTVESFHVSTQTRLTVDAIGTRPNGTRMSTSVLRTVADFDVNPANKEPDRVYEVATRDGEAPLRVVVDRYFAIGEPYVKWHDDGVSERLGVELDLAFGKSAETETIRLDEGGDNRASLPFGQNALGIRLFRATPAMLDALLRKEKATDHGRVVIRDAAGAEVLAIAVTPPAAERDEGAPATLSSGGKIPGTDLEVRLVSYYDNMRPGRSSRGPVDASPGNPQNPVVMVEITGAQGADKHAAIAFRADDGASSAASGESLRYPYTARYEAEPRIEIAGPQLLLADVNGRLSWIYASSSGERTSGEAATGSDLPLPIPAIRIRTARVFRQLRVEDGFEFRGYKADRAETQVIRLSVAASDGSAAAAPFWLRLGTRRTIAVADRTFVFSWAPAIKQLGFSLELNRFHRDFYPGSAEESSFESYCRLVHPRKFSAGEDIKIDMNHPLRLDGWRLFQSRFGGDGRTTILQVNRDPGLVITYPACAVVLLGLVVVFFMKRTLLLKRRTLEARGASPARHLVWALGSVAAVGFGPVVFGVYAAVHERFGLPLAGAPAFLFGVILLLAWPFAVVWWVSRPMHRRLAAELGAVPAAEVST
jgi:hypothetical protein